METVYKKYRPATEILMEYYWYYEHRDYLRDDWKKEDEIIKDHCDKLYKEYEEAFAQERSREENSKSARIGKKLETMKLTDELVTKIKLRNEKK